MNRIALLALAAFVFSIPTEDGVAIAGIGSLSRLIGFAAIAAGLLSLFDQGRLRFRNPTLFLAFAGSFVLWATATYFWSVAPDTTLVRIVQFVQLFVLAWLIHQVAQSERERDFLLQAFVLGCYLMIAVALAAYIGSARDSYRDVVFGANSFAITAGLAIPMAWGLMLRRSFPLLQVLNALYPILAMVAVVLAASRGGLITAFVGLTMVFLTLPRLDALRRLMLFGAVLAGSWFMSTWLPQAFPDLERNLARLERVDEDLVAGTMTGRTVIWAAGAEVFQAHPVLGVGVGAYGHAVQPIIGRRLSAHNAFVSVAVTSGLVGFVIYAGMLVSVLLGILAKPARRVEYLVLLFALVVAMMPSSSENNKFVWFVIATLASARPIALQVVSRTDRFILEMRSLVTVRQPEVR